MKDLEFNLIIFKEFLQTNPCFNLIIVLLVKYKYDVISCENIDNQNQFDMKQVQNWLLQLLLQWKTDLPIYFIFFFNKIYVLALTFTLTLTGWPWFSGSHYNYSSFAILEDHDSII